MLKPIDIYPHLRWISTKQSRKKVRLHSSTLHIHSNLCLLAPSRVTIQEELMVAEIGDHSIRGQTSWITCGMKIQEIQYAPVFIIPIPLLMHSSDWQSGFSSEHSVSRSPQRMHRSSRTSEPGCKNSLIRFHTSRKLSYIIRNALKMTSQLYLWVTIVSMTWPMT